MSDASTPSPKLQEIIEELSRGVEASEIGAILDSAAERLGAQPTAPSPPSIIQEFRPLFSSLESELAQVYWQQVGVQAFAGNEVPFIINNDGRLSKAAAELAFENCVEFDSPGPIRFLELGAGSGLFARFFLDAFRDLCRRNTADYYDRLTYFVSDMSRRTVEQWHELGQFDEHRKHVVSGTLDAVRSETLHTLDGEAVVPKALRGVFANYVLDVLPATVVRAQAGTAEQLCVRTYLADESELQRLFPEWDIEKLRTAAESDSGEQRTALLSVLSLLEFNTAFVPVEHDATPYLDEALSFGAELPRVLLNFGAFSCLESLLSRITDTGFVLINDYGPVRESEVANFGSTTRFGRSIAMGINFPLLGYVFERRGFQVLQATGDDERSIHSRLLSRRPLPKSFARFEERFCVESVNVLESPINEARHRSATGRMRDAFDYFRKAVEREPDNWCVLGEAAEFLVSQRLPGGIEFALLALRRNPWYSAWLWNTLGDAFFQADLLGPAHMAYEKAHGVSPADVVSNYNLSFTFAAMCRYRDALDALATALSNDFQGSYRERILHQQQRIMFEISNRWSSDAQRVFQRASAFERPAGESPSGPNR